jgi:hypothetical protein
MRYDQCDVSQLLDAVCCMHTTRAVISGESLQSVGPGRDLVTESAFCGEIPVGATGVSHAA